MSGLHTYAIVLQRVNDTSEGDEGDEGEMPDEAEPNPELERVLRTGNFLSVQLFSLVYI